ncbi:MAG: hypothetical protein JHC71_00410 [Blastococcus sp.]|nr:hypothetical protein [Blastococcus sp.]
MELVVAGAVSIVIGTVFVLWHRQGGVTLAKQQLENQRRRGLPSHPHYGNAERNAKVQLYGGLLLLVVGLGMTVVGLVA